MKKVLTEELIYEILSVVEEIPFGRVASYGQLARLIGRERNARLVGRVLRIADEYGAHFPGQRALLEAEGVAFLPSGHVDMARFRWDC